MYILIFDLFVCFLFQCLFLILSLHTHRHTAHPNFTETLRIQHYVQEEHILMMIVYEMDEDKRAELLISNIVGAIEIRYAFCVCLCLCVLCVVAVFGV